MKSRVRGLLVFLFAAFAGITLYFLLLPLPPFAIVGGGLPGMEAVPPEGFRKEPIIDRPFGWNIQYPRKHRIPKGLLDRLTAGAVIFDSKNFPNEFAGRWLVGGQDFAAPRISHNAGTTFMLWRKVFGVKPVEARPIGEDGKPMGLRLRLPELGIPAPKIPSGAGQCEGIEVRLTPRPWVGPDFPIYFEATVHGAPVGTLFTWKLDNNIYLLLEAGKTSTFARRGNPGNGPTRIGADFTRVTRKEIKFAVKRFTTGPQPVVAVHWPDTGKRYAAFGFTDTGDWESFPQTDQKSIIQMGGIGYPYNLSDQIPADFAYTTAVRTKLFRGFQGDWLKAYEYMPARAAGQLSVNLGKVPTAENFGGKSDRELFEMMRR